MAAQARHLKVLTLIAAFAVGGCGGTTSEGGISGGGKVIGKTVTVYALTADPGGANRDFVDAQKLALSDAGGRAGPLAVNFSSLDLGADATLQAQAARRAIADPAIIAAIVDANTVTVPLFNAAGLLQVAPGGDATLASNPNELPSGRKTVSNLAHGNAPADFARRFETTFGRKPAAGAERGYLAMQGVVRAIADARASTDRTSVIDAYMRIA